eukprot:8256189-Alexandrium_andersonii.AAC.1
MCIRDRTFADPSARRPCSTPKRRASREQSRSTSEMGRGSVVRPSSASGRVAVSNSAACGSSCKARRSLSLRSRAVARSVATEVEAGCAR